MAGKGSVGSVPPLAGGVLALVPLNEALFDAALRSRNAIASSQGPRSLGCTLSV